MTHEDGKRIKKAVDEFLKTLDPSEFKNEAINWADLHCCGVYKEIDLLDSDLLPGIHVEIEGAAPDSHKLQNAVERFLVEREGYSGNVHVTAEW